MKDDITCELHPQGLLEVSFDRQDSKLNVLGLSFKSIVNQALDQLEQNESVRGLIFTSKKSGCFIAGGDIKAMLAFTSYSEAYDFAWAAQEIFTRITRQTKPVICAIDGLCFGVGLELALACSHRLASDASHTKFALPELKLGLIPGGGGTQRLPRLIGFKASMQMLLFGQIIQANEACQVGLVDQVIDHNNFKNESFKVALNLLNKPMPQPRPLSRMIWLLTKSGLSRGVVKNILKVAIWIEGYQQFNAPYFLLDAFFYGLKQGLDEGLAYESKLYAKLTQDPQTKQMIQSFLDQRKKKKFLS